LFDGMRVTNQMLHSLTQREVGNRQSDVYTAQARLATGRRIERPSDDPSGYARISGLSRDLSRLDQFSANIDAARLDLMVTDNAIQRTVGIFQRAQELVIEASDGTVSDSDLKAMATEVNLLLDGALDAANSSLGGRYVFSGNRSSTRPFSGVDTDADGLIDTVTYNGDTGAHRIEISEGTYMASNVPGGDPGGNGGVFQTDTLDLFQDLIDLRDTLNLGTSPALDDTLQRFEQDHDHLVTRLSSVGAHLERLSIAETLNGSNETSSLNALDQAESIDIAEAVVDLSRKQAAYEAALRATAALLDGNTLINYL
jgi:flagellar hook-associated protein 3 FlgL